MRDYEYTFYYNFIKSYERYSKESVNDMGDVVSFNYRGGGAGQSYSDFRYFKLDLNYLNPHISYWDGCYINISTDYETLSYFVRALYHMLHDDVVWFSDETRYKIETMKDDIDRIDRVIYDLKNELTRIYNTYLGERILYDLVESDFLEDYLKDKVDGELERLEKNLEQVIEELNEMIEFEEFEDEEEDEEVEE